MTEQCSITIRRTGLDITMDCACGRKVLMAKVGDSDFVAAHAIEQPEEVPE
jgi:hypothetical protein